MTDPSFILRGFDLPSCEQRVKDALPTAPKPTRSSPSRQVWKMFYFGMRYGRGNTEALIPSFEDWLTVTGMNDERANKILRGE